MADRAGAERGCVDLAGIGFRVRDELGDGVGRHRRANGNSTSPATGARSRRKSNGSVAWKLALIALVVAAKSV
jgi:hypothetical protein